MISIVTPNLFPQILLAQLCDKSKCEIVKTEEKRTEFNNNSVVILTPIDNTNIDFNYDSIVYFVKSADEIPKESLKPNAKLHSYTEIRTVLPFENSPLSNYLFDIVMLAADANYKPKYNIVRQMCLHICVALMHKSDPTEYFKKMLNQNIEHNIDNNGRIHTTMPKTTLEEELDELEKDGTLIESAAANLIRTNADFILKNELREYKVGNYTAVAVYYRMIDLDVFESLLKLKYDIITLFHYGESQNYITTIVYNREIDIAKILEFEKVFNKGDYTDGRKIMMACCTSENAKKLLTFI